MHCIVFTTGQASSDIFYTKLLSKCTVLYLESLALPCWDGLPFFITSHISYVF